jgi:hypothetical protein
MFWVLYLMISRVPRANNIKMSLHVSDTCTSGLSHACKQHNRHFAFSAHEARLYPFSYGVDDLTPASTNINVSL